MACAWGGGEATGVRAKVITLGAGGWLSTRRIVPQVVVNDRKVGVELGAPKIAVHGIGAPR